MVDQSVCTIHSARGASHHTVRVAARTQRNSYSSIRSPCQGWNQVSVFAVPVSSSTCTVARRKPPLEAFQPPRSKSVPLLRDFLYQGLSPRSIVRAYVFRIFDFARRKNGQWHAGRASREQRRSEEGSFIAHLTKCLTVEWGKYGITVNAVGPTFIRTPGTEECLSDPRHLIDTVEGIAALIASASLWKSPARWCVPRLTRSLPDHWRNHPDRRRLVRSLTRRVLVSSPAGVCAPGISSATGDPRT